MFFKFRLRQSQHPDDVNIHKFFAKDDEPIRPPKIEDLAIREYDKLRKQIITSSITPQVLKKFIGEIEFYKSIHYIQNIKFINTII